MLANWRQLSLISLGALVIKAIGLLRGIIVAGFIGANGFLDAYYGVLVIVGFFVFVFADQLEMLVSEVGAQKDDLAAFSRQALTTVLGVSTAITALLYLALPLLLPTLLPELSADQYGFARKVTGLISLLCCIYPPYRVLLALFRCRGLIGTQVGIDALNSILFCALTIPALYLCRDLAADKQVLALAASHSAGFLSAFIVGLGIWKFKTSARIWGHFSISLIRELGVKAVTLSAAHYALYLFTFIDRFFAGRALPGGVSLLGYAGNISLTARSLINFEQIYLIDFVRSADRATVFRRALVQNAALSSVIGAFLYTFSKEIITVVYQRGAFTPQMAADASQILAVYGLSTLPFLWWGLLFRALQVQGLLGRLPLLILLLAPIDYLVTWFGISWFGFGGAVLGTMICHILLIAWGLSWLRSSLGTDLLSWRYFAWLAGLNLVLLVAGDLIKGIDFSNIFLINTLIQASIYLVVSALFVVPDVLRRSPFHRAPQEQ